MTAILVIIAVLLAGYGLLNQTISWNDTQLLRYQSDKLRNAKGVKVLLVGDSSLGNAIDASAWSEALQKPVLSSALTGLYGLGGSLNMIRRAVRTQPIETVIVFQHTGFMARAPRPEGGLLTAERWADLDLVPFPTVSSWLVNFSVSLNVLATLITGRQDRAVLFRQFDYVPQAPALPDIRDELPSSPIAPADIDLGHSAFLSRIGALCEEKKIRCLYAHGPFAAASCVKSGAFIAEVNRQVRAAGLIPVSKTPICMSWQETGDTPNHVRPSFKPWYSERYLELIGPYLN